MVGLLVSARWGHERGGTLELDGDREALLLALANLIGNAVRWSPEGSVVHVALTGRADEVELTVDDSGPGIPVGERERIFEPFYRGRTSPDSAVRGDRRRVGYGLGLDLAKSAVTAHGGSIEVGESQHGGARFAVRIPR